ncbi:MAG: NHL repeat-containing protein [Candidatus Eisenbacteria bacterium]|nr:NHL repeat-containing protein [Candidatus Eisenbacteria bacterium]
MTDLPTRRDRRAARLSFLVAGALLSTWAPPGPAACVTQLWCVRSVTPAGPAQLSGALGIAVDHRGSIVIADTGNHRVLVLTTEGESEREFGGYGWEPSRFDGPADLAVYPGFYVYVLDRGNRRVQRFDKDGNYVDTVVGDGALESPVAVAVGRSGEVLLLDADARSVLVFSRFGQAMPPIGRFGAGAGGLVAPAGIAVGPRGEIAVADPGRRSVEVFDEFGAHVRSVTAPDSLTPVAVAFDRQANLFVADEARGRVLAFSAQGVLTAELVRDDAGLAFRPTDLAPASDGSLVVLDGAGGRFLSVTVDYGDCRQ